MSSFDVPIYMPMTVGSSLQIGTQLSICEYIRASINKDLLNKKENIERNKQLLYHRLQF